MATITSQATGDWHTGGTWVGGVAPSLSGGDLAIIANGHTVTIKGTDSILVGDGTAGHLAISTSGTGGTGILICEDGFALTLTSGVKQGHANWVIGRGTITYTNASNGNWQIGDADNNDVKLDILGASGTYGTLSSSSTGILSFNAGGFLSAGLGSIRYYNLTKIGNGSVNSWTFNPTQSGDSISIKDCNFTNCGQLGTDFDIHVSSTVLIEDTVWASTPGACIGPALASSTLSSGTRSIQGNNFDSTLGVAGVGTWKDFTIRFNLISRMFTTDSSDVKPAVFGSNVLIQNTTTEMLIQSDTSKSDSNFFHMHSTAGTLTNVHGLQLSKVRDVTFEGWFIEPGDTDTTGDYILGNAPSSARAHTVRFNVARLNKNGQHGGMFHSNLGGANYAVAIRNNTYFSTSASDESGSCSYGETYLGHANIYSEIVNNLVMSNNDTGYVFIRRALRTFQDGAAAANIHHNGKYRLSAGSLGVNGYEDLATSGTFVAMFSTTTGLGASDVTANPQFVDRRRSIAAWAVARGYSTALTYNLRVVDAYAAIAVDRRTRIPDLISYCFAGFAPTNTAFQGTGSGSVDIGAVAVGGTPLAAQTYYTPRVVANSMIPTTQTNFPATVLLNASRYKTVPNSGHVETGNDIRFYLESAPTAELTFKKIWYNASAGTGEFHVLIPSIADATAIRIGYGNAELDWDASSSATWPSQYKMAVDFGDGTTLDVTDKTSNARNGTNLGPTATTGLVGGGISYGNNTTDQVTFGTAPLPTTGTLSFWIKPSWLSTDSVGHAIGFALVSGGNLFHFIKYTDNKLYCGWNNGSEGRVIVNSGSYTLNQNAWNKFDLTWDSAAPATKLFLNNVQIGTTNTTNGTWDSTGQTLAFGHDGNLSLSAGLTLFDALTVTNTVLSNDWRTAVYNNEVNEPAFWADGTEVVVNSGGNFILWAATLLS